MITYRTLLVATTAAVAMSVPAAHAASIPSRTVVVSGNGQALPGNGATTEVVVAGNGKGAAITTTATDVGPLDGNGVVSDIVIVDFASRAKKIVSAGPLGVPANAPSVQPSMSADARTTAFTSLASNLVPGDVNGLADVFVSVGAGAPVLVSAGMGGAPANGASREPVVSGDGAFVVFTSEASNLVPNDTNGESDVFIRNVKTNGIARVTVGREDAQADGRSDTPAVSRDGRYVTFASNATNLDRDDEDATTDVYIRDRRAARTELVSITREGRGQRQSFTAPFRPVSDVSGDGRYVAFDSPSDELTRRDQNERTDVFVRDRRRDRTALVSAGNRGTQGNNDSVTPTLSADGRFVAFQSFASNLANGGTTREDIYVRDRGLGLTSVVDVAADSTRRGHELLEQILQRPSMSDDGETITFISTAANVVPPDTNRAADAFARLLAAPNGRLVSSSSRRRARTPELVIEADDTRANRVVYRVDDGRLRTARMGRIKLRDLSEGRHEVTLHVGGPGMLFDPNPVEVTVRVPERR